MMESEKKIVIGQGLQVQGTTALVPGLGLGLGLGLELGLWLGS